MPSSNWLSRVKALFGGRRAGPPEIDWPAWEARIQRIVASEVERVLPYFPDDGVIVDVGANVGIFTSTLLAKRPNARAFCFEPVHEFYERCKTRFADNPNVVVENLALGDVSGSSTIYKPAHNPGGNSIVKVQVDKFSSKNAVLWSEEPVEVRIFDDYARQKKLTRVDLVKTDTEGHDYAVLKGVVPFLERTGARPVILSELLAKSLHHAWDEQAAVVARLDALGYEHADLDSMREIDDILFVPKGRAKS